MTDINYILKEAVKAGISIDRIIKECEGTTPPVEPPVEPPVQPPVHGGGNYLTVGKGSAAPGETVMIQILGQTQDVAVNGYGMYFGVSAELEMISATVAPEIKELINLTNPMSQFSQRRSQILQESFVAAFTGFFQTVTPDTPVGDLRGRDIVSIVLPPDTPLAEITFRVPANAAPGKRYHLDNRTWYYGREFKDGAGNSKILKTNNIFTTAAGTPAPYQHGVDPVLTGGWIDVV
jgi:hypothetical protein